MDYIQCSRPDCRTQNPSNAKFCRKCGQAMAGESVSLKPYHILHPEMDLKPFSEFKELFFFFRKPDYVEDPHSTDFDKYLFIVKNGKVGILHWNYKYRQFWENKNEYTRIIPCKYDKIIKRIEDNMFECQLGNDVIFIDLNGNKLK